jgi:hypothetical protein
MKRFTHSVALRLAAALLLLLGLATAASAQVTTGALAGQAKAETDGSVLPGVAISAVHTPTGISYTATTGADGRFTIPNVRVGGPYTITAKLDGFRDTTVTDLTVNLGATTEVTVRMPLAAVSESIEVVGTADDILNSSHTGSATAVSLAQIESLPTVRRSLQDFARTNPYVSIAPDDASSTVMSIAGKNNRYNTIQIDGAVDNDLFGLAASGTPGGQSDTQPIALDAIEQIQVVVSPYDVRQGGFTGGGLNAVTRSGSNEFHGSAYGSKRNESYVGDGPFNKPIAKFKEDQYGFRVGGPVLHDKLFFFLTGERNRKSTPTGVSADGTTGTVFFNPAEAAEFKSFTQATYGYDPGSLGDISGETPSDLAFLRFDWNASQNHQLTLRHNYVDSSSDVIANRSRSTFRFPTAIYAIADKTNSTIAQLNSVFGSSFNEGRIGYQTIRDVREVPVVFPSVEIGGTGARNGELNAGTERFSGANSLDQDILEITDNFTMLRGPHSITVGTHNEFFKFDNLFLSDFYGYYYFPTLADYEAGTASQYSISFANGSNPRAATSFKAQQYGLYAGDDWRVNDRFTLTFGLRADASQFPDRPSHNQLVQDAIGYDTASTPSENAVLSPRIGFNWDPLGDGKQQVRGGVGVFAGRTPYVWISNAFANTGVESTSLTFNNSIANGGIPFIADPNNQPHNLGAAGALSVDLVDPSFKFPRVFRGTLGYDRELFWGVRGTAEVIYTKTQEDVFYKSVNRVQNGTSALDGRPTYTARSPQLRDAYLLTNTSKGDQLTESIQLSRPYKNGLTLFAAYTHMEANSAFDATSSRAVSNFQFAPSKGDIYKDENGTSLFEVKHRINVAASYTFSTGPVDHTLALYYNVQSGSPYSLLVGGDPNRDGFSTNDLLYVPRSADEIIIKDYAGNVIPYSVFASYLHAAGVSGTAGRILDRNESVSPWAHLLDFHYALGVPIKVVRTEVTFDILNLLNLFDSKAGVVRYVAFGTSTPVNYRGTDAATGKAIYQEAFRNALQQGSQFSTADVRSRWQAKLGLRFTF